MFFLNELIPHGFVSFYYYVFKNLKNKFCMILFRFYYLFIFVRVEGVTGVIFYEIGWLENLQEISGGDNKFN